MEVWKIRTLLMYLILSRLYFDMTKTDNFEVFDALPRLKELCPYSYFCGLNATKEFQLDDNRFPCCDSCSCSPDCGYHGNCCYSQLHEYNSMKEDSMICRNTYEIDLEVDKDYNSLISEPVPHYWIVNKCSLMTEELGYAAKPLDDTNVTFAPVFSSNTGTIYYNVFIAMCNNVTDVIPWQRILSCSPIAMASLSDIMDNTRGESTIQECRSYFSPPETDASFKQCYTNTIRQCNVTGQVSKRNEFWPLCAMFNSTFIITTSRYVKSYANVYCYKCNTHNMRVLENIVSTTKCYRFNKMDFKNQQYGIAFTVLLNLGQRARETPNLIQRDDQCGRNRHMVKSFTNTCRSIRCPSGQILYNEKCDFYSEKWIGGPFVAMLRLSPMYKDVYLQTSILEDLITKHQEDKIASWIHRNTLRRWNIIVFYHPFQNFSHVEYITIKAVYPHRSVNPRVLTGSVKEALQDVWTIKFINDKFSFHVDFNEFEKYSRFGDPVKVSQNVSRDQFYPHKKHACEGVIVADFEFKHILYSVTKIDGLDINRGLFLTKMFYCNQIELLPEEFEFSPPSLAGNILFKVKNLTMHTIIALPRADNVKFQQTLTHRIFVCLNEFGITVNGNVCMCVQMYHLSFDNKFETIYYLTSKMKDRMISTSKLG